MAELKEKKENKTPAKKSTTPAKKFDVIGIFEINKMQYIAKEGETIATRIKLNSKKEDIDLKLLGLIRNSNEFEYGKPYLDYKVDFEVGKLTAGKKITSRTYKAKTRTRRNIGFRPKFMEIKINSIKASQK